MRISSLLLGTAVIGLVTSAPALAQERRGTRTSVAEDAIIVTATMREQTLQEVPISVAVVGGDQLEQSGILLFDDVKSQIPNLQIDRTNGNFAITMRGLGSGTGNLSFEQSVGLFVDGVYFSRARAFQNPMLDVQRIEAVRGPQGALFGKNTNAGAISVITRRPTREFEGFARASAELEHGGWNFDGAVSGPLNETLSARLTGRIGKLGATMKNIATNKKENSARYEAVRGQILWEPVDNFDALVKVEHSSNRIRGGVTVFRNIGDLGCGMCDAARTLFPDTPNMPSFERAALTNNPEYDDTKTTLAQLTMNLTAGDWLFTSTTSWQKLKAGVNTGFGGPTRYLDSDITEQAEQIFQELKVQRTIGENGAFFAGLTYIDTDLHIMQDSMYNNSGLPFPFYGHSVRDFYQKGKSWSPFAAVDLPVTPELMISGSLRYSHEKRDGNALSWINGFFPPTSLPFDIRETRKESLWDYSGRIRYQFSPDANVYVSYATGTKGGGFVSNDGNLLYNILNDLGGFQYDSERARSWEVGAKFRFLEGRGNFNIALFHTKFKNLQVSEYNGTSFVTGNAASALVKGVEVDGDIAITDNWRLGGSAAYLDASYDDYPGGACLYDAPPGCTPATNNLAGVRLTRAPEWTGSGFIETNYPVKEDLYVSGRLSTTFQSRTFFQPDMNPLNSQGGFAKIDARLAVGQQDGKWEVALVGRNLANKVTTSQGFDTPAFGGNSHMAMVGAPRTVTVQVSANF